MHRPPTIPDRPFTWTEVRRSGMSRCHLDQLVETGRVRRVVRGVYQRAEVPDTLEHRARAVALVTNDHALFCDRTAAWLHGVDVLGYTELEILPELDCVVPSGRHRVERGGCLGGERTLTTEDVCTIHGVAVTTPLRTAFDLACVMSPWNALATLDQFMRICGVTHGQMAALLPRFRGRRGVVQLRALVPLATPEAESPGESWARIAIHDEGLPAPKPQHGVLEHGDRIYRLDLAYPRHKIAIEYDGLDFHDATAEQREADRARREWLRDRGWHVIVLTKRSFSRRAVGAWTAELREELAARRPARLARH